MADEQLRQTKTGKQKTVQKQKQTKSAEPIKKVEENIEKQKQVKEDVKKAEEKVGEEEKKVGEKEAKKPAKKKTIINKHEAKVYGRNLPISLKYSKEIGKFIRHKPIENAINDLELVLKKKKVVPMRGELPHKRGKGIMSGKYPIKASQNFIKLLKSLNGNATMNGLELEKTKIIEVICNKAPDQMHKGGRTKSKRTHVLIKSSDLRKSERNKTNPKER